MRSGSSEASEESFSYSASLPSRDFFSFSTFCAFFWSFQNPSFRLSSSSSFMRFPRPSGSKITSHFLYLLHESRKLASYFFKLQHIISLFLLYLFLPLYLTISSSCAGLSMRYVGTKPSAAIESSST